MHKELGRVERFVFLSGLEVVLKNIAGDPGLATVPDVIPARVRESRGRWSRPVGR
jgi:hypothetical protein